MIGGLPAKPTVQYGKHKIPRYIYHLTNKANYDLIKSDGLIKTSKDELMGKGVFAVELSNLFKRWNKNNSWGNNSLIGQLLRKVSKNNDTVVILKIPTNKLNQDNLYIRSQNIYADYLQVGKTAKENLTHVKKGTPAKDSHLLKGRKHALEYIYKDDIPIVDVEKIGEVDLRDSSICYSMKPMKSLFEKLLKGTPESKSVELLKY